MVYRVYRGDLVEDKADFIDFWRINFPRWPASKYDWLYENNIYGPAVYWVARRIDENDKLVGTTVQFPKLLYVDGKPVMTAIVGDFGVGRKYRGFGPAGRITAASARYKKEINLEFLYATPNMVSEKVATRYGSLVIGRTVRMVKVLRSCDYLRRYLKIGILAKILSKPCDFLLRLMSGGALNSYRKKYKYELPSDYDERFDVLWEKASKVYPIIAERNSNFLHWRFTLCPFKKFSTFALVCKETEDLVGYITYRFEDKNLIISDLLAENTNDVLDALLAAFLSYQRGQDVQKITLVFFGIKEIIRAFDRFGFSTRPDNRSIIVHVDKKSPLYDKVTDGNNWYFLESDNDA